MKKLIDFIFSPNSVILIPIIIIIYILLSNYSMLMEKMGFETRTTLKAELVLAKEQIRSLKQEVKRLNEANKIKDDLCKMKEETHNDYVDETKAVDDLIQDIINKPIVEALERHKNNKMDDHTPEPIEVKEESYNNPHYSKLELAYNSMFGE